MKKIEEPIVKVMNLEAMDVIATSGPESKTKAFTVDTFTNGNRAF